MTDRNLTHKELSAMLGVSETTIKSYRRKFPGCIPVASKGKPIRFTPEAGTVCVRIRDMFNLGMSVEEVRSRLAQEFDWIDEAPQQKQQDETKNRRPDEPARRTELSHDFSASVSNLAKSMVALTQQQASMLQRLQNIEEMLRQLGLSGPVERKPIQATLGPEWDDRFERMQQAMEIMAQTVTGLRRQVTDLRPAPVAQVPAGTAPQPSGTADADDAPAHTTDTMPQAEDAAGDEQMFAAVQAVSPGRSDPPRRVMILPLVFQSSRGEYLGVAGKARGRFSANDLKALLAMTFFPPERYTQQWEQDGNGWWLLLTQPESATPREFAIYMEETVTPRGNTVALVLRLAVNGEEQHPVELHNFISEMQGE
jgi:DNA-binding transcriptional MerR regulator